MCLFLVFFFLIGCVFFSKIMNFLCWWLVFCFSQVMVLFSGQWWMCLKSLVSLCVSIIWWVGLKICSMDCMVLMMWCGVLQNISVVCSVISFCKVVLCWWVLVGRKLMKWKWVLVRFEVDKVVIVVEVLGKVMIWNFVVCMVFIIWVLGLEMVGVLVFEIRVMCWLVCRCLMILVVVLCLLCLWVVSNCLERLQCCSNWLVLWVFLQVIVLVMVSICRLCRVMLQMFLMGVVSIYNVDIGQFCWVVFCRMEVVMLEF